MLCCGRRYPRKTDDADAFMCLLTNAQFLNQGTVAFDIFVF